MNDKIVLKRLTEEHIDLIKESEIENYRIAYKKQITPEELEDRVNFILNFPMQAYKIIAYFDNKEAGLIFSTVDNKVGHIRTLYVKPEFRRNGIATMLVNDSIKFIKCFDVEIVLEVAQENVKVKEFYKNLGFNLFSHIMRMK